jgi:hypothetical protein
LVEQEFGIGGVKNARGKYAKSLSPLDIASSQATKTHFLPFFIGRKEPTSSDWEYFIYKI